jgi:hypothetical protein
VRNVGEKDDVSETPLQQFEARQSLWLCRSARQYRGRDYELVQQSDLSRCVERVFPIRFFVVIVLFVLFDFVGFLFYFLLLFYSIKFL